MISKTKAKYLYYFLHVQGHPDGNIIYPVGEALVIEKGPAVAVPPPQPKRNAGLPPKKAPAPGSRKDPSKQEVL